MQKVISHGLDSKEDALFLICRISISLLGLKQTLKTNFDERTLRNYNFTEEKSIVAEMMNILAFWTFEGETNFSEILHFSNHTFSNLKKNIDQRKKKFELKKSEEERAMLLK